MVALLGILATSLAPTALAANGQIKLALLAVEQPGSYFDLTMRPGESRSFRVDIANDGDAALAARTYAADVYTIINGGFGGRLRGEPQNDMSRWLDYPTEVFQLPAGKSVRRTFRVEVPPSTEPGEYIASLILENDQPIPGDGAVALDQIVRQAVAVVVTVPGRRSPALEIGEASHKVVAGRSIVAVAVANPGNIRLKPLVGFTLRDAAGAQVSRASVQMDTFYAHTDTFVEVPLAALLLPGRYTVELTLVDAAEEARAASGPLALVVEAPAVTGSGGGVVPGLTDVTQPGGDGHISIPVQALALAAGLLLGGLLLGLLAVVLRRRRRTRSSER